MASASVLCRALYEPPGLGLVVSERFRVVDWPEALEMVCLPARLPVRIDGCLPLLGPLVELPEQVVEPLAPAEDSGSVYRVVSRAVHLSPPVLHLHPNVHVGHVGVEADVDAVVLVLVEAAVLFARMAGPQHPGDVSCDLRHLPGSDFFFVLVVHGISLRFIL